MSVIIILIQSCVLPEKGTPHPQISIQGGAGKGGIVENTDLKAVLPGIPAVDAFTGATRTGINLGVHLHQPLWRNEFETGIEYMHSYQTFFYNDAVNMHIGARHLDLHQVMFPLTYNVLLLKKQLPEHKMRLKVGYLLQNNTAMVFGLGLLPEYSLNKWSGGAVFGASADLIRFRKGGGLGIYFDCYRGSRVYTDFYNRADHEMPGTAFFRYGIRYTFKTK